MYIRTKDGVYKIDEIKPYFLDEKQKLFINNELKVAINEQRVINQSENLEELCDEFVMTDNSNNKPYRPFIIYGRSLEELKERQSCNESLYGAIWTDKGLIYVAKMDNEGKLVLI